MLIEAYHALNRCLAAFEYAPRQADTGAFSCRRITGGTGYSLHAYAPGPRFAFFNGTVVNTALAVDINWQSNPYGRSLVTDMPPAMVAAIKAIRTTNGRQVWRWGGDYAGNKDAMHYEITCHPADLATGIDPTTIPGQEEPMTPEDKQWIAEQFHEHRLWLRAELGTDSRPGQYPGSDTVIGRFLDRIKQSQDNLAKLIRDRTGG